MPKSYQNSHPQHNQHSHKRRLVTSFHKPTTNKQRLQAIWVGIVFSLLFSGTLTFPQNPKNGKIEFSHTMIHKGKKVSVTISSVDHPNGGFNQRQAILFKTVKEGEKPAKIYYKTQSSGKWEKIHNRSCLKDQGIKNFKRILKRDEKKCVLGQKVGKAIARSIAYMAIIQPEKIKIRGVSTLVNDDRTNSRKTGKSQKSTNLDKIGSRVRKAVRNMAKCLSEEMQVQKQDPKKVCILRSLLQEGNLLADEIAQGLTLDGFKCDYQALKQGKCKKTRPEEIKMRDTFEQIVQPRLGRF